MVTEEHQQSVSFFLHDAMLTDIKSDYNNRMVAIKLVS